LMFLVAQARLDLSSMNKKQQCITQRCCFFVSINNFNKKKKS